MIRTQIQLTDDQYRRLKQWAAARGISLAEAVRRFVVARLEAEGAAPARADAVRESLAVVGKYSDSGQPSTVARDHDDHLAQAFTE
jgi:hypothetical protein